MLLMTVSEAALAIGAQCGGSSPGDTDPQMLLLLRYMLPRVEAALNVESLVRGEFIDHYYLSQMPECNGNGDRRELKLRLSNGFVVPDSISISDPDGVVSTGADLAEIAEIQHNEGVLTLLDWKRGVWSVAYTSGYEPTEEPLDPPEGYVSEDRVLQGVPDWIKAICIQVLVLWYRSTYLQPKMSKGMSFEQVDQLMRREMLARIYEKYMRPRVGMVFSERMDRVEA